LTADALSTALFIMGKDAALSLVSSIEGVEALLVDKNLNIFKSAGFHT
jgi:thiamine biosynthesis lipoprotein